MTKTALIAAPAVTLEEADSEVRAWVRDLGAGGYLRACAALDVRALALTRETLAYHSALADFAFAMQGLGSGAITLFAAPDVRDAYLARVVAGKAIAAFALSEREAGSDVAAITTTARRDGDAYVIDGEKTWISNGGIADFYTLFVRTADTGAKGLSAFVVDAETAGFEVTARIDTMSPHPLGTLRFNNVRVPVSNRLG